MWMAPDGIRLSVARFGDVKWLCRQIFSVDKVEKCLCLGFMREILNLRESQLPLIPF